VLENNAIDKLNEVVNKLLGHSVFTKPYYTHVIPRLFIAKYSDKANDLKKIARLVSLALSRLGLDDQLIMLATNRCNKDTCKELYEIIKAISSSTREYEDILDELKERTSLYYTIIIGDGDNFGKLIKGVTSLTTSEYLNEINKALPRNIRDQFQNVANVLINLVEAFNKFINNSLSSLGIVHGDTTIIISPSYHSSISRGQMITSIIDILLCDLFGGFVVYSGGDDIAVMAPTYIDKELLYLQSLNGSRDIVCTVYDGISLKGIIIPCSGFIPANIIVATRRNYWDIDSCFKGFHIVGNMLVAATTAYGRSYGLLITHYKDPLWPAWRLCRILEEYKDGVRTKCSFKLIAEKDVVVALYGRLSGLAQPTEDIIKQLVILPNVHVENEKVGYALLLATIIAENLGKEFSNSLLKDVIINYSYAYKSEYSNLAFKLLEKIIDRNTIPATSILAKRIKELLGEFKNLVIEKDVRTMISDRYELLPWIIMRMSDYLKSGSR